MIPWWATTLIAVGFFLVGHCLGWRAAADFWAERALYQNKTVRHKGKDYTVTNGVTAQWANR